MVNGCAWHDLNRVIKRHAAGSALTDCRSSPTFVAKLVREGSRAMHLALRVTMMATIFAGADGHTLLLTSRPYKGAAPLMTDAAAGQVNERST
jgi:hypothetical protein